MLVDHLNLLPGVCYNTGSLMQRQLVDPNPMHFAAVRLRYADLMG